MDTLIIIPTYREVENLRILVPQIMTISPNLHLLIVDDDSQDGTYQLVGKFKSDYGQRVELLTRQTDPSYAASLLQGMSFAIKLGYEAIIQMDADGSHPPSEILDLVNTSGDVVIGSRYMKGAKVKSVPLLRRVYSIIGNVYISIRWRSKLRDKTNGFRLFRGNALKALSNFETTTTGFAIQIEILRYLNIQNSIVITEIPTVFNFREIGSSKFNLMKLYEAFQSTNNILKKYKKKDL